MKKRFQVQLSEEAQAMVEATTSECNTGFEAGSVSYSDTINEMILTSKVDIKTLQMKHADLRRSLRSLAKRQDLDVDTVIKLVSELRNKGARRSIRLTTSGEENA